MRKKRETAEIKAWREILEGNEADLVIAQRATEEARKDLENLVVLETAQKQMVERTRARLAELEGRE